MAYLLKFANSSSKLLNSLFLGDFRFFKFSWLENNWLEIVFFIFRVLSNLS